MGIARGGPAWDRLAAAGRRRRRRRVTTLVLVVALAATLAGGWWWWSRLPSNRPPEVVTGGYVIAYVSDGDTVVVADSDGVEHSVRLVGINAPEVAHGSEPAECFGPEARDEARQLLPRGTPVVLVADPALPAADQWGRRLAYVEVGGVDVGRRLLERGGAVVYELRSQATPSRSVDYRAAERAAASARTGLWGACPAPPSRRS